MYSLAKCLQNGKNKDNMLNLLFPKTCIGCETTVSSSEELICVSCRHLLPLTNFHTSGNQNLKKKFYGRFPVMHATSLLYFEKSGLTQKLMHHMKYRGVKELSSFFGKWLGSELVETSDFKEVQMVIPVPLHKQKLKRRGYNQVEGFGRELAKALQIPYQDDILIKVSKTSSQVLKSRLLRFQTEEMFTVQNISDIQNQHILLVDDIITTGATLENCALQLLKGENVKISIATIATTY